MKKIISVLLAFSLLICAFGGVSSTALANEITFSYNEETAVLTLWGSGKLTDFTEQNIKTRPWHVYCEETRTIIIEDGIESIGDFAFARFSELRNVQIPDSVTYIGNTAFGGNAKLREITIPDSVAQIEPYAFGYDYEMCIPQDFVTHCSHKSVAQDYCIKNAVPFDVPMQNNTAEAHITTAGEQVMWSFVAPTDGTLSFNSLGHKDTFGLLYDSSSYSYATTLSEMKRIAVAYDDDSGDGGVNFKFTCKVEGGKRYYLSAKFRSNSKYDGSTSAENGRFDVQMTFTCDVHNYEESVVPPTCTQMGYTHYQCRYCEDNYDGDYTDTVPHTHGDEVITRRAEPTCTQDGLDIGVVRCSECGIVVEENQYAVPALGHNFVVKSFDGTTVHSECDRCLQTNDIAFTHGYNMSVLDNDEYAVFDMNNDGIINAKDYVYLMKL